MWLEGGGENGGEGDGDGEKLYFWLPGPTLMGRGEGGVGGDDVGEGLPSLISSIGTWQIKIETYAHLFLLKDMVAMCVLGHSLLQKYFPGSFFFCLIES